MLYAVDHTYDLEGWYNRIVTPETLEIAGWAFLTGTLSALATGLGAIPVLAIRRDARGARAWASGAAAGMMIWASLDAILAEGMKLSVQSTLLGALLGAGFLLFTESRIPEADRDKTGWMLWLVMLVHSFPEGLAIGVGFATGDVRFGLLLALVISLHNIPEGLAISLALRAEGASFKKCFWFSVYSSVPQPIVAVPAAIFVSYATPLMAPGLGFAAGAMLMVAFYELLPKTSKEIGKLKTGLAVALGALGMAGLTTLF